MRYRKYYGKIDSNHVLIFTSIREKKSISQWKWKCQFAKLIIKKFPILSAQNFIVGKVNWGILLKIQNIITLKTNLKIKNGNWYFFLGSFYFIPYITDMREIKMDLLILNLVSLLSGLRNHFELNIFFNWY